MNSYFCLKCKKEHKVITSKIYRIHYEFRDFNPNEGIIKKKKIKSTIPKKNTNYRKLFSEFHNITLKSKDIIHHIDLDSKNNEINNLWKTDKDDHKKAHKNVNRILKRLLKNAIKNEIVYFDKLWGKYFIKNNFEVKNKYTF